MAHRKPKRPKLDPSLLQDEQLILICDWGSCRQLFQNMELFLSHVADHAGQVVVVTTGEETSLTCIWEDCGFETSDQKEIIRHIYYHAYHTKIKCLGANLIEKLALQGCQLDPQTRNSVPELSGPLICYWDDCKLEFLNVQQFYWHVHTHSITNDNGEKKEKKCLWANCKSTFANKFKLRDHLRSHSQERSLACPTCGSLFASRTKLHDHCLRQLPLDANEFRCSECSKLLPTERLLREHVRYHRLVYTCSHCPIDEEGRGRSFPNTHSLGTHISYCHSESRPFPCPETDCSYSAKSQTDLSKHLEVHANTLWYCCEVSGCDFTARNPATLQKHVRKVHQGNVEPLYECHVCQVRFHASNSLKSHLGNLHKVFPLSGNGRFKYQQGQDGIFRAENGGGPLQPLNSS
ncbi:histone H4 transcription factor-like [Daphnia carinata]|uniref:histone H4 transcription factor-like n=1 Tax=Daphnia carinata TaxID=120202 RepID=UPI00257B1B66|nr:histone H4 transcription factor-like [Daphnia carinata]